MRRLLLACIVVLVVGCVHAQRPAQEGGSPAGPAAAAVEGVYPKSVLWFKTAAERVALFEQVYRAARERLPALAAGHEPGTWAVILDADETVLDNTPYQLRLWRSTRRFDSNDWNAWVRESNASELPGARAFIAEVRARGGKAIIVTNRDEEVCAETRANFVRLAIAIDGILCKRDGVRDKNPRFASVAAGNSPLGFAPLAILAYVGDNIQDFPDRTQSHPGSPEPFGQSLFLLPNPMYGSWEQNAVGEAGINEKGTVPFYR